MQASPNRRPARNWRPVEAEPGEPAGPPEDPGNPARRRPRRRRRRRGAAGRPRRSPRPGPRPARRRPQSSSSATARTWAWYHVVAELGGVPEHRPERRRTTVAAARTPRRIGSLPSTHQASPTSIAPRIAEDELAVGCPAPQRDERQEEHRRQRRERDLAARHAVARDDRQDVVEEGVAGARVERPDRVADRGLALEEGHGLPLEVVVDTGPAGDRVDEQGDRHEAQPIATETAVFQRREPSGAVSASLGGGGESGGPEGPCATLRSTSARSFRRPPALTARASAGPSRGADAPTRTSWTREGVVAILAVLGLALAARLIIAYAFPGTGLKFDVDSFHAWAADLARNGLNGVYDRRLLPRLHARLPLRPVAGRARRAGDRRHRRPDQDPADPRRRRDRLARLVDGPGARARAGGRPCSGRRSSSSTPSPGSTR